MHRAQGLEAQRDKDCTRTEAKCKSGTDTDQGYQAGLIAGD